MNSFKDLIDAFSAPRLSELFGVQESHIRTMRARDSIPPLYWPVIVANAPSDLKDVVTFDLLHELRSRRFDERQRGAGENSRVGAAQ